MKAQIHPIWHPEAKVVCTCGNTFTTGSTQEAIHVEVCSLCHPFFTGQMRYVDTTGRVDRFRIKQDNANSYKLESLSKKERRAAKRKQKVEEEMSRPTSLEEVRKNLK